MAKWSQRGLRLTLVLLILLFILYPLLMVFRQAFRQGGHWSLEPLFAYVTGHTTLIKQTLTVAVLVMFLTTLLAVAIAVTYYLATAIWRRLLRLFLLVTLISPPFISALAYIHLFGRRGLITYRLLGLRLNPYGLWGIVVMETLGFVSFASFLLINALERTDHELLESAYSLGARTSQVIKTVLLPLIRPTIFVVMLLTFIRALADFSTPTIIGGNYNVLATEAYLSMIAYGKPGTAAVINVLLLVPALIAFYFYRQENAKAISSGSGQSQGAGQRQGGGWLLRLFQGVSVFFLLMIGTQYATIIFMALSQRRRGVVHFTLDNFKAAWPYLSSVAMRSILYALLTAVGAVFLCSLLAYFLYIQRHQYLETVEGIATLPYIIPGSFFGLGYILAFSGRPFFWTGTATIVVLNMLFKLLPLTSKLLGNAAAGLEPTIFEASRDLGGPWYQEYFRHFLPLAWPNIQLALLHGFISSMTTIGSIIFLIYPGQKVLTLVLFELIGSGKYDTASALTCWMMLICLAFAGLMQLPRFWKGGRHALRRS